jgi:hypothetical protein
MPVSQAGWAGYLTGSAIASELSVPAAGLYHLTLRWREDGVAVEQIAIAGNALWRPLNGRLPLASRAGVAAPSAEGAIVVEAESPSQQLPGTYDGRTWTPQAVPGAVGSAVRIMADAGLYYPADAASRAKAASAAWFIRVPAAGTYDVWLRAAAPDGAGNSIHVGAAGDPSTAADISFDTVGAALPLVWAGTRTDGSRARLTFAAPGVYALNAWMREDGVVLDRIVLQPSGAPAPSGLGPAASPVVSPLGGDG